MITEIMYAPHSIMSQAGGPPPPRVAKKKGSRGLRGWRIREIKFHSMMWSRHGQVAQKRTERSVKLENKKNKV